MISDLIIGLGAVAIGILLIVEGIRGMRLSRHENSKEEFKWLYKDWIIPMVSIGLIILIIVKIIQML